MPPAVAQAIVMDAYAEASQEAHAANSLFYEMKQGMFYCFYRLKGFFWRFAMVSFVTSPLWHEKGGRTIPL